MQNKIAFLQMFEQVRQKNPTTFGPIRILGGISP